MCVCVCVDVQHIEHSSIAIKHRIHAVLRLRFLNPYWSFTGPMIATSMTSLLNKYGVRLLSEMSTCDDNSTDMLSHEEFSNCIKVQLLTTVSGHE